MTISSALAAGLLAWILRVQASAAVASEPSSSSAPVPLEGAAATPRAVLEAALRRSRRAQADNWGSLGDFFTGDFDVCSMMGTAGEDGIDVECSTDDGGMTTISAKMDGDMECLDPDFCVRDVEVNLRMDIAGMLEGLFSGTPAEGLGDASFDTCFTYQDTVVEEQLRGKELCFGASMSLDGGATGGKISSCDVTLDEKACQCEVCDGQMGMAMSCDGVEGVGLSMECTDFPLAEEGIGAGGGDATDAIQPRNMMIPRLISSAEGGGNKDAVGNESENCAGSRVWCSSMKKCLASERKCLSDEAIIRRRRRRRKKRMFKKKGKNKKGGRKKRVGLFQGAIEEGNTRLRARQLGNL